jgi:hypothetical protein
MDDFDTDFKNPIGIFNPGNGSKLDLAYDPQSGS